MSRRARRNHTPAFKAKVALAAVKGDRTIAQLAEQFDVHPQSDHGVEGAAGGWRFRSFLDLTALRRPTPAIDVKSLHAKIGELTLENDS